MAIRFDKNGNLKPYRMPWAADLSQTLGVLANLIGLIAVVVGLINRWGTLHFVYAFSGIIAGCLLSAIGHICADIHYMRYLSVADRLREAREAKERKPEHPSAVDE